MKHKNQKPLAGKLLFSLYHYFCFFLVMAFVITCCMILFLNTLTRTMGFSFTEEQLKPAAIATFGNVVLLSLICTVIDALRRRFTVDRPVKRITEAAERITKGDYSVRIPPLHRFGRRDGLDEIADCFNRMAEELSGTETLRTDFISNVSHELKTPLAVMQNYGTLLSQPDLSEEERIRYAGSITATSQRLANLVTNILKLDKLENQQIYPVPATFDLSEQICRCLLMFEDAWEKKDLEVETSIRENVRVTADTELLGLVWNNLFSNAVKFTEPGGKITVTLTADESDAVVRVSDTGCGISPEVGAHIFEKFYQGDTSHATEGNGLGLALVKRVVDITGADIAVSSEPGRGTTFTVRLEREHDGTV